MALTQTLETLIERAVRKGVAVKRVRECNIMGRNDGTWFMTPEERRERVRQSPMVEQWKVEFNHSLNQDGSVFQEWKVYHYDTLIFHCSNTCAGGWILEDYYGESRTDADALDGLCAEFGINKRFSYRPSVGELIVS